MANIASRPTAARFGSPGVAAGYPGPARSANTAAGSPRRAGTVAGRRHGANLFTRPAGRFRRIEQDWDRCSNDHFQKARRRSPRPARIRHVAKCTHRDERVRWVAVETVSGTPFVRGMPGLRPPLVARHATTRRALDRRTSTMRCPPSASLRPADDRRISNLPFTL